VILAEVSWLTWTALALLGAWLAADENSLVQSWLSQPLPAAILAGLVVGDATALLVPGLLLQLVVIGNLPVGTSYELDPSSATVGVLAGAQLAGWPPPPPLTDLGAWTATDGAGLGWLVVMGAVASQVGGWLVHAERQYRLRWMLDGYRSVRDGDVARLEGIHRRCLAVTASRGALLTVIWTVVSAGLWRLGPGALPGVLQEALAVVPLLVPVLATGTLIQCFGPRRAWPLVALGVAVGFAVGWLVL
jgi:mannose/fructose/N-acetylgalactosamine-specific phosphotransferase system component IIC